MQTNAGNLFIRVDATTVIGTGHVMRCIALAQAWQDHGGKVTFLSYCESDSLQHRIRDEGFEFLPIEKPYPDTNDLNFTLNILSAISYQPSAASSWLALDGYHFTPDYQKAVRDSGYRLLVIDDMAHLDHYHADILVNQNIDAPELNYSCDKNTIQLFGCDYVMLRREFLEYRNWKREIPEKARKILVTLGGGDPDNVTLKVIKALQRIDTTDFETQVIVGPSNPHLEKLQSAIHNPKSTIHILQNVTDMPELMAWADLAISAGGSTCWEFCFMGVPAVVGAIMPIEEYLLRGLEKKGLHKSIGRYTDLTVEKLTEIFSLFISSPTLRKRIITQNHKVIDGKGTKRICERMICCQA